MVLTPPQRLKKKKKIIMVNAKQTDTVQYWKMVSVEGIKKYGPLFFLLKKKKKSLPDPIPPKKLNA